MVVLTWVHHKGDLALVAGTAGLEGRAFDFRYIFAHQIIDHLAGAAARLLQKLREPFCSAWLVKARLTGRVTRFTLCELLWIHHVHSVVPTVMDVLDTGILVITFRIKRRLGTGSWASITPLMRLAEEGLRQGWSVALTLVLIQTSATRLHLSCSPRHRCPLLCSAILFVRVDLRVLVQNSVFPAQEERVPLHPYWISDLVPVESVDGDPRRP